MLERIRKIIDEKRNEFVKLSDYIWDNPETAFQEFKSSRALAEMLEEHGFQVEKGLGGMETAFKATYGSGRPVIGFIGEYDALPGLSQKAGEAEKIPLVPGGPGHGCGHHVLGVNALAAAIALKTVLEETGLNGTVVYFGCPAEENYGAKSFLARDGFFDDMDVAFQAHPTGGNRFLELGMLANLKVEYSFSGITSHASGAPHKGRSALDAAELMVVGTQFLREHVIPEARFHHAYLHAGESVPNIVPDFAKLVFSIRAPKSCQVQEIYERICDVAKGAALMTGTSVDIRIFGGMKNLITNGVAGRVTAQAWQEVGSCEFSPEAYEMAKKIAPCVGNTGEDLLDSRVPPFGEPNFCPCSSDLGDVSHRAPTVMIEYASMVKGTEGHTWPMVSQGKTAIMYDGMIHIAKVMALAGLRFMENPELAREAKEEWLRVTGGKCESLLPPDLQPGIK